MAITGVKGVVGALVAGSLIFSSSAALATPAAPQADPWAVLTAMSGGAPAAAMCGSAAAATTAQAPGGCVLPVTDAPPPPPVAGPPPPAVVEQGGGLGPLFIGLLAVAAGVGIFLALRNHDQSNSPA
ncbi:MAG TPA: hypothetical protein VF098_10500 [Sphingomicrobium sp.]|jgi:hypothetical protein